MFVSHRLDDVEKFTYLGSALKIHHIRSRNYNQTWQSFHGLWLPDQTCLEKSPSEYPHSKFVSTRHVFVYSVSISMVLRAICFPHLQPLFHSGNIWEDQVSKLAVCMTLKPIWIHSNRNAFGVNDEENKMPSLTGACQHIQTVGLVFKKMLSDTMEHIGIFSCSNQLSNFNINRGIQSSRTEFHRLI